jgi:hypothetical protein
MQTEDNAGGNTGPELSPDDILSKLNESSNDTNEEKDDSSGLLKDTKKDVKEEVEDETSKEDDEETEVDELKELEEELKEPTEDDLDLKTPVNRRQLKNDYPDIFKKHPGLESTIYRERAYTELLPTIQDAKEALNSLQTLERFEADLKLGKTSDIMRAVKEDDPNGFAKLADNYMQNLAAVDERAFHHVIGNVTKDIVEAMIKFGRDKGDENIQAAASTLYQFMFNSTKWQGKQKLSADDVIDSTVNKDREELNKQRQEFESTKQKEHINKVMTSVNNQVKSTIEKSIDSKDQMTPFVKNKAIEEVINKASKLLEKDTRFQQIVKQLTDKAGKEKFSDEAMNRIRSTYLNKYKGLLLPVIKAVKSEALRGISSSKVKEDKPINDTTERANRGTAAQNDSSRTKSPNNNKPLPGESSLDFLMRRAK